MERDRSAQIERIYRDALARDEGERASFVAEASSGDYALQREVESLLKGERSAFINAFGKAIVDDVLRSDSIGVANEEEPEVSEPSRPASLPYWAQLILAAAAIRTAAALTLYFGTDRSWPVRQLPYPAYAALAAVFTAVGIALVVANRRDQRASWLGGVFILVATPLANPFLIGARWLFFIRLEAFTASFFWYFITLFPNELEGRPGRLLRGAATASAIIGLMLFVADLAIVRPRELAAVVLRLHWAVSLGLTAVAFPVLLWRTAHAAGQARRRARLFVRGLLLGIAPVSFEILLEEAWPAYKAFAHRPDVEPIVGSVIFGALAIVPFVTAYSVLYDRVVEMRVVLRTAIQYALARYTIIVATLVPFAALAVFVFTHREEPLVALTGGPRPLVLIAFAAGGLAALRMRADWLESLDRKYFREAYDARQILTRVVNSLPGDSHADIAGRLQEEIGRALHVEIEVFLIDARRTELRHVRDRLPPLSLPATVADLVLADSRPMDVDLADQSSPFCRLPQDEQRWLSRGNFRLLVPLRAADGRTAGILAVTPKRSGLPYSDDDRRLLTTIAATASLALDSLRLRNTPDSTLEPAARECLTCSRLSTPEAARCACGGLLIEAAVPHTLRGVFRFEQRIGAGGMGVVYRAVDMHLHRLVAIKALPRVTPARAAQLRREARAMAAVTHTNLAVVHGIELWQDTPFLVQEYLAGGTLAERLAASRLPTAEALELGITLSELLHYIHGHGVIHCDIKPSNIGFTEQGVAKLLDFGLAHVFRDAHAVGPQSTTVGTAAGVGDRPVIAGTPQFMSPEAARGDPASPLVDLWALCVVLYRSLTGQYPFNGPDAPAIFACILDGRRPDLASVRPDLALGFVPFFERAFERDPARRYVDAGALTADLRRLLAECS